MQAGRMNRRIEIQQVKPGTLPDEYGDQVPVYETIAQRWAEVIEEGGGETWRSDQVRADRQIKVSMRYCAGLSPRHRLKMGNRVIHIESIANPDGRRIEHVLACREEIT